LVVTMSRWAAESVVRDCGVLPQKVGTILPGANIELPADYNFPDDPRVAGKERPLVLGFIGKDWRRKGLLFLLEVRGGLQRRGMATVVRAAGYCPPELARRDGLEFVGFIDKAREAGRFLEFLKQCDIGCLFSEREPLGISTLEFLRAGVPVAGFAIEGVADTLPLDAGFRFSRGDSAQTVAEVIHAVFQDGGKLLKMRNAARLWSPLLTWERCVAEWTEFIELGSIKHPVRPWLGLPGE